VLLAPATTALAQTRDVEVADNKFAPEQITREAGATVTWLWTGANPHTVTSTDGRFASSAQKQGVGNTHSARFPQPGSYPYVCSVHAAMSGTITINGAPPPSPSPTPAPRPTPAPTSARPAPAPSTTQPSRSAAASPTSRSGPSPVATPTPAVVASATPSPSPASVARTSLVEPSVAPTPSRVPSRSSAPLATLDEPLPKDRSGLAIALGLVVAAAGFGTAGALLLRRRTRT